MAIKYKSNNKKLYEFYLKRLKEWLRHKRYKLTQ